MVNSDYAPNEVKIHTQYQPKPMNGDYPFSEVGKDAHSTMLPPLALYIEEVGLK